MTNTNQHPNLDNGQPEVRLYRVRSTATLRAFSHELTYEACEAYIARMGYGLVAGIYCER